MNELHYPWIEIAILLPLLGAGWVAQIPDRIIARRHCLVFAVLASIAAAAEAWDFYSLHVHQAEDHWHLMTRLIGRELFVIDELSAPLVPLTSLLFLLTALATLRTKVPRFSFSTMLVGESIALAMFSAIDPWVIILMLIGSSVLPYFELRSRGRPTRLYAMSMITSAILLVVGWYLVDSCGRRPESFWRLIPLLLGVSIRCGIFPFQTWLTDLYENATFGTALLMSTPLAGAYAALRLIVPYAPEASLRWLGLGSLLTAVLASALSMVQKDARRFFCCMVISHTAMVLIGLEVATPIGLTGAMCVWLSAGLSLGGFGLTLRALEARRGRLKLTHYQGLYEHAPALAICFLLTGLGCVGFPGTIGFIGTEMLIDGAVGAYPHVGPMIVIAATFNGIAIMRAYFLLFTGVRYSSSVSLQIGGRERIAVLTLAALVLGGGFFPQPGVSTAFHASQYLIKERANRIPEVKAIHHEEDDDHDDNDDEHHDRDERDDHNHHD
jgi:NADH-quinone oxidoreductase subunit M